MEEGKEVEQYVKVVGVPKGLEGVTPGILSGKDEDDHGDQGKQDGRKSSHRQEDPVGELGQRVRTMENFAEEASQIICRLSGDVVEVETVTDGVHDGKDETI